MTDRPISLSTQGPPSTVLPAEPAEIVAALHAAQGSVDPRRGIAAVVAAHPRSLAAWCALGDCESDTVARYAAYRVGYHRGLDTLRANGWRGSGFVRWADEGNRAFLGCLRGLGQMAEEIGERDEAERIALFLVQLDPTGGRR